MSDIRTNPYSTTVTSVDEGLRQHMVQVYKEMSISLIITGLVAYIFGHDINALASNTSTFMPAGLTNALYNTPLVWVVMLAPLAMAFLMGGIMRKSSASAVRGFLYAFAAIFGLSLSYVFVKYTGAQVAQAFFATSGAFAALSLWGYTTKRDISGWGSFLFIGLIGLIIVSIINIFLASSMLSFAISAIGVFIFAGLTAYDTQTIKTNYLSMRGSVSEEELAKLGTLGAMNLFLDFILLFQHLLELLNIFDGE